MPTPAMNSAIPTKPIASEKARAENRWRMLLMLALASA
jgi:hypothetical protein